MDSRVVVTGMGVLTSTAEDLPAFADALKLGLCGISGEGGAGDGLGLAARIPEKPFADRLAAQALTEDLLQRARKTGARQPRSVQISILTALEAWVGAGMASADYPADEVSIVVAGHNIGQIDQYRAFRKYQDQPEYIPARYALHYLDTNHIGAVSEVLGLQGEGISVGAASASGNAAILQGFRQVQSGRCKACVVVGAMADLSPVEVQAFRNTGALGGKRFADEPTRACRPFDRDREGFIYGQGGACVILENAETAAARGAPHWGKVLGGAICLDGNSLSDPRVEGEARALRKTLEDARLTPGDVAYVNAHATSSVLGDQVELEALEAVFGAELLRIWVNATKGLVGHCLYAAGVVEAVAVLVHLQAEFLHPNRNLERPISGTCRFVGKASAMAASEIALSNAFGFGGLNTSIAFCK